MEEDRAWRRPLLVVVTAAVVTGCGTSPPPASTVSPAATATTPTAIATASTAPVPHSTPFVRSDREWTTYMGDPARSGIGPTTPAATAPHRTWTASVDGDVYAEPLVAGTSVIVATERDSVYALDATSGATRWRAHLGEPVRLSQLQCGNIDPSGITSTPVVDAGSGIIYTVAFLDAPLRHELFALRVADGGIAWHRVVDPPNAAPRVHQQRGSLNLANGRVYFSYGGFAGDCGRYNGWVVASPTDGTGPLDTWRVPSNIGGAIWAPPGPVVSAAGEVWVATGNTFATTYDDANTVERIDATLSSVLDRWTPQNWSDLNRDDIDLGSVAPALLPGGLIFAVGKEGIGYLLRGTHLGGIGGEAFKRQVCLQGDAAHGAYGGVAVAAGLALVACKDGLAALRVDASAPSFALAWRAAPGANSAVFAYGLVWTVATPTPNGSQDTWHGSLVGLDPTTGAMKAQLPLGTVPHYPSPAAARGSLYVAGLGSVYAVSVA